MLHLHSNEVSAMVILLLLLFTLIVTPSVFPLFWQARSWLDILLYILCFLVISRLTARGSRCLWPPNVDFTGRVALVVGASSGVGFEVAAQLAMQGWTVILAGRHRGRLLRAQTRINHQLARHPATAGRSKPDFPRGRTFLLDAVDFLDKESVRRFASSILSIQDRYPLALLVNAAGVLRRHLHYSSNKDWWDLEEMLATNAVGPMLLTKLLLPALIQTAERSRLSSRVVNVASSCHTFLGFKKLRLRDDPIDMICDLKRNARLLNLSGVPTQQNVPEGCLASSDDSHYVMHDFPLLNFIGYYGLSKLCVIWNTRLLAESLSGLTFDTSLNANEAKALRKQTEKVISLAPGESKGVPSQRQRSKVYVACVHPGISATHLYRDLLPSWFLDYCVYLPSLIVGKTLDELAQSTLKAAVEEENIVQGGYYMCDGEHGSNNGVNCLSKHATDAAAIKAYAKFLDPLLQS
ncbi:unnamed protein product [Phytomonas sp. Hart1]|nr:unnamed protein product [Phytomonas sp. Hart1]|eukprot:CCW69420.1 unnamed protein product [Phytomonas sp. isolate Hart1]